ncbi:MAG: SRPBCC family protein [Haloglomus sp.]
MFEVEEEIQINAPASDVFSFLDDPRNHVKITPALIEVNEIETLPNGGKRATYSYKLAGVTLTGQVEDIERSPSDLLVQELSGAIEGTITYDLDPTDGGTHLDYEAAYELPDTVVNTVLAPITETYNQREAESTLANLKAHLEA